MKLLFLLLCSSVYASFEDQLRLSIDERKVTVKMMTDRLKALERRQGKLKEITAPFLLVPESIQDELELLDHDKRSLHYIIKSMKEDR